MKKALLIILLFTSTINALGQKLEPLKEDKFTHVKTLNTTEEKIVTIGGAAILKARAIRFSNDTTIEYFLALYFKADRATTIDADCKVYLKLMNQEIMELPYLGNYEVIGANETLYFPVKLDKKDMDKLSATQVTDIRLSMSRYTNDYVVNEKRRDVLPALCKLILQ